MKLATFSFDDGGPADFEVLDLFRKHGITPTFYIATALLNMDEMIYGMPSKNIGPLYAGSEIGSHTASHPHLSLQNAVSTRFEIETSKRVILEKLGVDTVLFAHPYGSTAPHTASELRRAGYQWARRIWRPWNMEGGPWGRYGMPISCMFTSPDEEALFDGQRERGDDIHVLGHSWWIIKQGLLPQLEEWIQHLLADGYTILPNSTYFQRTLKP